MVLEEMNLDSGFDTAPSDSAASSLEDPKVLVAFADLLYKFKQNAEETDFFSIVKGFREVATTEALKLMENANVAESIASEKDLSENWLLEIKFWSLIEILIGYRYSDEYAETSSVVVNEATSHVVIKDAILRNDKKLRELDLLSYWLVTNLQMDEDDQDINPDDLQSTKWLHTKIDLQSNSRRPDLVSTLDSDAMLRNGQSNKRAKKINEKDAKNDELFFKQVFGLLLEEKHDQILQLCEATNNWTLAAIMAGVHDYVDPEVDTSLLRDDDEDQSMGEDNTKSTGIKNKLLWRRTVYALSTNPNLPKYERAVYSFLSGDYASSELTNSWERQLLIFTNNMLQTDLEENLVQKLNFPSHQSTLKLSAPKKKFQTMNEVLNFLSKSADEEVRKQSSHSIRVLIGSIITNNVSQLISNSIALLDGLILANDSFRNESNLSKKNTNNLIKESYLLRILTHFIIFMKFLDDQIISDDNLVKLIKIYLTRLSLYKLYDLIPVYISYIPSHADVIENYSFFLSNIIVDKQDRIKQLSHMRVLELPLEDILKKTVERMFTDTEPYYKQSSFTELNEDSVSKLDLKLINAIGCFVDASMLAESIDATIALSRRFAANGRLQSLARLYESFDLNKTVNEYRIEKDIMREYYSAETGSVDARYKVEEISQYQMLIQAFNSFGEYSRQADSISQPQLAITTVQAALHVLTEWLTLSIKTADTKEDVELYKHLRRVYIPYLLFKSLDIIKELPTKETIQEFRNLVNIVSNDKFAVHQTLSETSNLPEALAEISEISLAALAQFPKGVYS